MKIYSEKTNKEYDTVDECLAAEKAYDNEQAEKENKKKILAEKRKERAAEIDEAYKEVSMAQKHYNELLEKFIEDFGSYHATYYSTSNSPKIFSPFERLLDMW